MKVVAVSGNVCTGKTTLSRKLADKLDYIYVDVNKLVKAKKLSEGFDKKRKCLIVDIKKLNSFLVSVLKSYKKDGEKGVVIDSHLSHNLPKRYIDLCIITKCSDLKKLKKRLEKRGYNKTKVMENIDCEIFDICLNEAKELKHKILIVDTRTRYSIEKIVLKIR